AVFLPQRDDWPAMLQAAREAEDAGVDQVLLPDHLAYGPWALDNSRPGRRWRRWPQAHAGLGFFRVLSATFRPPGLLAKMVDALDQIAAGSGRNRYRSGIGPGRACALRFALPTTWTSGRVAGRMLRHTAAVVRAPAAARDRLVRRSRPRW